VLAAALAITVVTYIYTPTAYIRFGILHLLAAGMLAAPLFRRTGALSLAITGTGVIVLGRQFTDMTVATAGLIPFGLQPPGFASLDYYPLFPWLGVILFGMAAGKIFYPKQQSYWPSAAGYRLVRWLSWLGRRSLLIYLMHQPIILSILYVYSIAEKTLRAIVP
ncbi:MAG: heparan-alpha-glucosaminide N-acetyltransferase, partial [Sporomusa sp.]